MKQSRWVLLPVRHLHLFTILFQHFNNEAHEIGKYDQHLSGYEKASVKIATSLAYLNSGQNIIFSSALTGMMFLAAQGVINGPSISSSVLSLL